MTPKSFRSTDGPSDETDSGGTDGRAGRRGSDAPGGQRLQKLLSRAGVASRREAERLIQAGRVSVDGRVVTELGTRVDPDTAQVCVDGARVDWRRPRRYLLLNKPPGYITTVSDTHGRPTVLDLVPGEREGLFPVGRLDLQSEGLLLLTDDGALANRLIHPRYHVPKTYEATVRGVPSERAVRRLREGVELADGRTAPADVGPVRPAGEDAVLTLTIREGKKRQVRRMLDAVGHPVTRLVRVAFGPLRLEGVGSGETRELDDAEIASLREATGA